MTKIIKYYMDIECEYKGNIDGNGMFRDLQNWTLDPGLIGILGLEIDTENETKEEIFFKQIFCPVVDELFGFLMFTQLSEQDTFGIFTPSDERSDTMLVTWNGRRFDIPIIINNLGCPGEERDDCQIYLENRDRDLLDLCDLKGISIKGGLGNVIKRLGINYDCSTKDIHIEKFNESCDLVFHGNLDINSEQYKKCLEIVKGRNEFDVRVLPLLEEKFGYLYVPRTEDDKYNKVWY